MRKKTLAIVLTVCFIMTALMVGSSLAQEKTPIEIYKPGFKFPTEPITINFWENLIGHQGWPDLLKKWETEYSKIHPNVKIVHRQVPISAYREVYLPAFEAGRGPDIIGWHLGEAITLADAVVSPPDWVVKLIEEEYTEAAKTQMKWVDGKYYGWENSEMDAGQMLWINTSFLEEVGLPPDVYPKTLPELLAFAVKLSKLDDKGNVTRQGYALRCAGPAGGLGDKWSQFEACFRDDTYGEYFTPDFKDVDIDSPGSIEAMQLYQDMVFRWKVSNPSFPWPNETMKLGLGAMTNSESYLGQYLKNEAPQWKFRAVPLVNGAPPYGKYEVGVNRWISHNLVTKDSKYPDIAWDINMFLNNDAHDLELSKTAGGFPRRKANENSEYAKTIPWGWVFEEMYARHSRVQGWTDPYGIYEEAMVYVGDVITKVVNDSKADVAAEMHKAQEKFRKSIKRAKVK